ncbi:MAG: acyl-protein synthetase [Deltaproteobacteria bacterium]|jgi:phenylacetate-coenzyme A ligase PaaK-like adenylate-forming protein|nr:acyl-protein synthetase [Deltaproteobacteria bacterium]
MCFDLNSLAGTHPYGLAGKEKRALYRQALTELTRSHYQRCRAYQLIVEAYGHDPNQVWDPQEQPMLPVRLFKELELLSVPQKEVVKTMTSSGTSGQAVSKIFLDKENTRNQSLVLTRIINSFIGPKRLPLLILDTEMVKYDRKMYSARGAGIVGFSTFGLDTAYALDQNMNLDQNCLQAFVDKHAGSIVLLFGYTSIIWEYTLNEMEKAGLSFQLEDGLLFHIGGWKKLQDHAVNAAAFNEKVRSLFGRVRVHNYYGMAEQLGSVFVECERGNLHCSIYSDVIVRRPEDFSVQDFGQRGFLELLSLLPTSYPGHALLTEDEGEILGEDDCPCGRLGKYFKIHGRIKGAEIRGCSDTYEQR